MRGNPAPFLAQADRAHRPPQGRDGARAEEYLRWAESLADQRGRGRARRERQREAEFARLYADHDRLLDEAGAMDFGEMIVRAIRLLEEQPAARRRVSRALPRGAGRRVPGHQLRPAASCCGCWSPTTATWSWSATTTSRSTASGAPRARTSSTSRQTFPDAKVIRLETNYRSNQAILDAAHAVVEPNEHRLPKKLRAGAQPPRAAASTRCRSGAARTSARRRRRWPRSSSG